MASYRPKSLNELNNLYDKSMAAQNAIKKGSASATVKPENDTSKQLLKAFEEELNAQKEQSPAIAASQELSDVVGEFIKNFGETKEEKVAPPQPMPITRSVKSASVKPGPKKEPAERTEIKRVNIAQVQQEKEEISEAKKERVDLVRNAERSDLFNDYMKIMNDEDEESHFSRKFKKKKNKKDKHQGSPVFTEEEPKNEELKEEAASTETSEAIPEEAPAEVPYFVEKANEVAQVFEDAAKAPLKEESGEEEEFASFYAEENTAEEAPEETEKAEHEKQKKEKKAKKEKPSKKAKKAKKDKKAEKESKEKKPKKNIFIQVVLMIVLIAVLISAIGVTLMKVVVGVNGGEPFAEKYYVFTSSKDYSNSNINEGDLVITEKKELQEDDAFAYLDMKKGRTAFALKGSDIGEDMLMAHTGSGTDFIYRSNLRGAVIMIIPSVGTVVSAVTENFIVVIITLVAIALILILILAFAFKGKVNYSIDEDQLEYEEENETEQDEESEQEETQDEPEESYSATE